MMHFPSSDIHTITLTDIPVVGRVWHYFSVMPELRRLDIMSNEITLRTLFSVLGDATAFPALESLDLAGFTWNKCHTIRWKRRTRLNSLMLELIQILDFRKRFGKGIKMLSLSAANNVFRRDGIERDLPRLEALVEELACEENEKVECDSCAEDEEDAAADTDEDESTEEEEEGQDQESDEEEVGDGPHEDGEEPGFAPV
ncbi:uncharacterized protein PHACADRAFT_266069 [Phanerochaete carnosa HHB-10118-sp]|uniref:F-box domain-containing protein n=1 Tax=Phanerochaete carnosa (strain HHB-10118-sp) TaxID=650164 RepID=K5UH87_PHACS|nr:uncharacterized protein PHACADRAFT_266069 [Phanerochaete carnosa HHB-10118-sp]EKM48831.1 hypothetical protein PHACADRAFT_266069 [Phanerochaete carnosa HHB-10118-sp]